ncbi:zinc/cadmium resistance protein-like [Acanthaster planci]|uniref:Zinc/cadmium resistance protein-like n=1 Tax=Acanthaster planci TaxID=133434 RepID=A0A8B7ZT27_ACAPL|nr:zinc/cadmium resistance protein-like [Acanthaster planci]XP_022107981.1 zinc/cadmium resistance protein-like [Acanthaster planci]
MGRFTGKSCRFVVMMSLTTSFFLVELVTGYATKSLALVSDSFHMLSDIIALVIGFLALRISKRRSTKGCKRAEVLGALINSVLLIALCFTIFVDAIQRLIVVETIHNPMLVLIVGCVGLAVNGIGLCLFGRHGMPHGHTQTRAPDSKWKKLNVKESSDEEMERVLGPSDPTTHDSTDTDTLAVNGTHSVQMAEDQDDETKNKATVTAPSHAHLNMRGVFLHVLGDALGSVVVIVSALFIWLTEFEWRHYVDPAMSLIIVAIITVTTIPLFRQSSKILLQSLPSEINENSKDAENPPENKTGNSYVATAHILFHDKADYTVMADDIKSYLVDKRIDARTTLQDPAIVCSPSDSMKSSPCESSHERV